MKRIIPIAAASLLAGTMLASPTFAQDKKLEEGASASGTIDATGEAGAAAKTDRPAGAGASAEAQTDTSAEGTVEVKPDEQAGAASGTAEGRQQLDADAEAGGQDMQAEQDAGAATDGERQAGEGTDAASDDRQQAGQEAEGAADTEQQAGQETEGAEGAAEMSAEGDDVSGETTASINLSSEQETELRTVFVEREVEPAEIDIDVSVGTSVPDTVVLHPLPPRVIEIVPQYQGYQYFVLADGRIIIVEPATYEVVYIIVA